MNEDQLIEKYNVPGPRYTSYPTVPDWDADSMNSKVWEDTLLKFYNSEEGQEGISLYIHLPFCESLCTFCGCHKHITKQHSVEEPYINTVLKEWNLYLNLLPNKPIIKEIHLGGGTPTFFAPSELKRLIDGILKESVLSEDYEMSFEGHPNNTSYEHLKTLYDLGFRRVSFGVQDYSPKVQKAINRIQPFETVEKVHNNAREIGYTSISHDLVFGLPHQTIKDVEDTISKTISLNPERLSFYSYAHVPWVKGVGQRGFSHDDIPKGTAKRRLYEAGKKAFIDNGYFEVGMDHFALESDHLYQALKHKKLHRNFMGYTTNTNKIMIGLGMSAISDCWIGFAQNAKTVKEYQASVDNGELPIFKGHLLSDQDLMLRQHILNLMCHFETDWCKDILEHPEFDTIRENLKGLEADKLIEVNNVGVRVLPKGEKFVRNVCMALDIKLFQSKSSEPRFSLTI